MIACIECRGADGPDRADQHPRRFDLRAAAGGAGPRACARLLHARPAGACATASVFATVQPLRCATRPATISRSARRSAPALDAFDVVLLRQDPPFDLAYITTHAHARAHPSRRRWWSTTRRSAQRAGKDVRHRISRPDAADADHPRPRRDQGVPRRARRHRDEAALRPRRRRGVPAHPRRPQFRLALRHVRHHLPRALGDPEIPARGEATATSASSWSTASSPARSTACRRPTICAPTWCAAARRRRPSSRRASAKSAQRLGPALRERGLLFVGIDVIGGWLTEINVTSPTGIRAIRSLGGPDVAALIWDKIEKKRAGPRPR